MNWLVIVQENNLYNSDTKSNIVWHEEGGRAPGASAIYDLHETLEGSASMITSSVPTNHSYSKTIVIFVPSENTCLLLLIRCFDLHINTLFGPC